jgi:hypothetical protein
MIRESLFKGMQKSFVENGFDFLNLVESSSVEFLT